MYLSNVTKILPILICFLFLMPRVSFSAKVKTSKQYGYFEQNKSECKLFTEKIVFQVQCKSFKRTNSKAFALLRKSKKKLKVGRLTQIYLLRSSDVLRKRKNLVEWKR